MSLAQIDGRCNKRKGVGANIAECGFEDGDCIKTNSFEENYPDCSAWKPFLLVSVTIGGELHYVINNMCNLQKT
jgi:hypothetical protein